MAYRFNMAGKSDRGRRRAKNEDSFVVESEIGFFIVADGMGGHACGEVASRLATELCGEQIKRALHTGHVPVYVHVPKRTDLDPRTLLLGDAVKFANQAVYEAAQNDPAKHNMGTTMVAAIWLDDRLATANVGDSRIYTVHGGKLHQQTMDHSFVQEQINRGLLSAEDAEKSELRNMLTRSVGISEDVDVDLGEIKLESGDYALACSDGLTKMLKDPEIEKSFAGSPEPAAIVDDLIRRANEAGGNDNITVVVAQLTGTATEWGSLADRMKGALRRKARSL